MNLADRIASLVITTFNEENLKGKPCTRSNGTSEWTVLAGLVAIDGDSLELLCLTTGVKATPQKELRRSQGKIVHDCHAEILCLRAFNTFLLEEMKGESKYIVNKRWNNKYKLALYVSEVPCGDATMTREEGDVDHLDNAEMRYIIEGNLRVVRGRNFHSKFGVVRTKPGKINADLTYSKSCSDKLCIKQSTGILNCVTSAVLHTPVYLDFLVLHPHDEEAVKRSFRDRFQDDKAVYFDILVAQKQESAVAIHMEDADEPSFVSIVHIPNHHTEAILNGVKNGFYSKKKLRPRCESVVSRYYQFQLLPLKHKSYQQLKTAHRERIKQRARARLGQWIHTYPDLF